MTEVLSISITLRSDTLAGSGEGFGSTIDNDVVFDKKGLPYIPAKRIKGCLKSSACEVLKMFKLSKINYLFEDDEMNKLNENSDFNSVSIIKKIFGSSGNEKGAAIYFSNLNLAESVELVKWFELLGKDDSGNAILKKNDLMDHYTVLRRQTKIDGNGIAEEHTLRTSRVIEKGHVFEGKIEIEENIENAGSLLWLACKNLKKMGTSRNRGFGEIECKLTGVDEININKEFKSLIC
jgi:CRISPR-associated protein Csx10